MKFVVLVFSVLLALPGWAQPEEKPVLVRVAPVLEKMLAPGIWLPGTVISRQDARLSAEVEGALVHLVEVGTRVSEGDVLASLNDRSLQLRLQRDQAELARLQVRLNYAERELERAVRLSKTNSASQSRIDELAQARDVLTHEVTIARIAVAESAWDLERTKVVAPFDGVVVERFRHQGEYVTAGQTLLRLVNPDALEMTVRAPVTVSRYVRDGEPAMVRLGDHSFETRVRSVIPVGEVKTRMLEVRLELVANRPAFSPVVGDAVSVYLSNGPARKELVVPRDALIFRPDQVFVFRISKDQIAEKVPVKLGSGDKTSIAVTGALTSGDQVVIRGGERLTEGKKVVLAE